MTEQDNGPFGIFRGMYSLATWGSLLLMVGILFWVAARLFEASPVGTERAEILAQVRPTQTALVALIPSPTPGAVAELFPQCVACHAVNGRGGAVGPDLTHVASNAASRIEDPEYGGAATTAEDYLLESLREPNVYVVPGFAQPSVMPPWGAVAALADNETLRQSLIDYLMTLE
jgi:cytochrome c2